MNEDFGDRMFYIYRELKTIRLDDCGFELKNGGFMLMCEMRRLAFEVEKADNPVDVGISMKILAKSCECTPAMITKIVSGLEARELVRRYTDSDDRRGVKVCLTEKGEELWETDHKTRHALVDRIYERMGKEKMESFMKLLGEFLDNGKTVIGEIKQERKEHK